MGCAASSPSTAYREEHSSNRGESSKNSAEKYRNNTKGQQGLLQVKGNTTGATLQQQQIEEGDTIPLDSYSPQILQNRRQQQHRTGSIVTDHNCSGGGADNATEDNLSYFGNSSAIAMNSAMPRSSSLLVLHNNQQHQSNAAIDGSAEENTLLASGKNMNAHRRTSKESQQQQRHRRESLELGMSPNVAAVTSGKQNNQRIPSEEVDPQRRTSLMGTSQAGISQEIVYQETIVRATKENNAIEAAMMERAQQQQQLLSPKYRAVAGSGNSSRGEATSEGGSQELKTSQCPQISSIFQPLGLPSHQHSKGDQSDDLSTPVDPLGGHYLHHHHRINSLDEGESATHSSSRGGGMGGVGGPRKRSFNPSHMTFGDVDEDDDQTFTRHDGSGGGQQNPLRAAGGAAGGGGGESYSRSTRGLEDMLVSPTPSGDEGAGGKFNIISPKYNAAVVIAVLQFPTPDANRGLQVATTGAGGTLSSSDRSNDHPLLDDNDAAAHSTRTFLMQALPPASSSS